VTPSEEIKSKLDIVDVLREYLQFKQAGSNWRALCPFHREKNPSFMVSQEKQIWHCFGCSRGGDIFTFVMEMEGLSFVEALRLLAGKAGVELKRVDSGLTSQRNRLLDMMTTANEYYHRVLMETKIAIPAREYLKKRGLDKKTVEEWELGFSPDSWDDLMKFLKGKGYTDNEIFLAGLSVKKENSSQFYNRFRNRIMFPIKDLNGSTVAFTARVTPEKEATEVMGKYINSPTTMIYDKSRILFGLDKARFAIKNEGSAVLVEGQMDVIAAHQHGFKNVIASSGTALTAEQITLIKRYTNNISLAFDADAAGQIAADRGIKEAMDAEMNIKIIEIPSGKDPDDCIRNNPAEWQRAVAEAKPMMEYYFDKVFSTLDASKDEDRRLGAQKILSMIMKLNKIDQDTWIRKLAEKIGAGENILRETLITALKKRDVKTKFNPRNNKVAEKKEIIAHPLTREEKLEEIFLALILKFPILIGYAANKLLPHEISGQLNQTLYNELILYYSNTITKSTKLTLDYNQFKDLILSKNKDQEELFAKLLERLVFLGDQEFFECDDIAAKNEAIRMVILLKRYYLLARMKEIEMFIAEAEKSKDNAKMESLMEEFRILGEEMRTIGE
jgi:DNA primase